MTLCPVCIPWTYPLSLPAPRNAPPGAIGTLNYVESLAYRLHILHHQTPADWMGDLVYPVLDQPQEVA